MKQRREFASTLESCWRRENLTQAFLTKYFPISRAAKFSRGIIWIAAKIGGYSLPSLSLILFSPAICTFHKPFCFLSPTLPAGKINWKKEREGERKEKEKTHNAIADGNVLPTLRCAYVHLRTSVSLFSKTCSTSLQKFAALILSLCYPRGLVRFQLFRVTQSDTHRDEEKREERDRVHVWEKRYSRIFYFFSNSRFTMGCINYLEEWLFKRMSRVRENERTL